MYISFIVYVRIATNTECIVRKKFYVVEGDSHVRVGIALFLQTGLS